MKPGHRRRWGSIPRLAKVFALERWQPRRDACAYRRHARKIGLAADRGTREIPFSLAPQRQHGMRPKPTTSHESPCRGKSSRSCDGYADDLADVGMH
jgi:hypothetical protein